MLKTLKQIDRFYYFLGGLLTVLAFIAIIILRTIFSALGTASGAGVEDVEENTPRIDKVNLEETYSKLIDKKPPQLDL